MPCGRDQANVVHQYDVVNDPLKDGVSEWLTGEGWCPVSGARRAWRRAVRSDSMTTMAAEAAAASKWAPEARVRRET